MCERECKSLKEKVRLLQEEIKDLMIEREKEATSYEREMVVMSFKEADWRQERKRLREEVKELKKMVEEKEDKIREMTDYNNNSSNSNEMSSKKEWELMGTKLLVQKMKEERAWRDEAVEKWKQLYLAIKTELDDLIHRTYGALNFLLTSSSFLSFSLLFHTTFIHVCPIFLQILRFIMSAF